MKKTVKAFADVGSHGEIWHFATGPVAERYPHLMQIYTERVTPDLVPVIITYDYPEK